MTIIQFGFGFVSAYQNAPKSKPQKTQLNRKVSEGYNYVHCNFETQFCCLLSMLNII